MFSLMLRGARTFSSDCSNAADLSLEAADLKVRATGRTSPFIAARRATRRTSRSIAAVLALATAAAPLALASATYSNPLPVTIPAGGVAQSCADPTIIRGQTTGDTDWYVYCTSDPLNDDDVDALGGYKRHLVPIFRSSDLAHWTYAGDAFAALPGWAEFGASLWAPDINYFNGKYYLYYAVTNSKAGQSGETNCSDDSAIGVATAPAPTGPWTHASQPVVKPRRSGTGCSFYATIDPEVLTTPGGTRDLYYGSFNGGIEVRVLSADGLTTSAATATHVVIPNRLEAAEIVQHDGWYYLLGSAANCCNGQLTGYGVYAARSASPTGPFVDREGVSLLAGRAGGTPLLEQNGDAFVGPGHNAVFQDAAGRHWTVYHAVRRDDPYFSRSPGFTKRPLMLDPLDWVDGWPVVRGGFFGTTTPQVAPDIGAGGPAPQRCDRGQDAPGLALAEYSDEFDGNALSPQWGWVRAPAATAYDVSSGVLRFATQSADLYVDQNNASVLVESAPPGEYVVDVRLHLDLPADGCCHNYVQAGLVIYGDDDNYLKLVHASIWETRQTEWAKEQAPVPAGWARYGSGFVGPPSDWTYLRIVRRADEAGERYTAYTSRDGVVWIRGGAWTHTLGTTAKIGLVAMGGSGYTARFDWVHVAQLAPDADPDARAAELVDTDLDGSGDACEADNDADGLEDALDCAPVDGSSGKPAEVAAVDVTGGVLSVLTWTAAARADWYDVSRGGLAGLEGSDYGACFADNVSGMSVEDGALPAAGCGVFYLVRGVDLGCGGAGTWGRRSDGRERVDANAGACP